MKNVLCSKCLLTKTNCECKFWENKLDSYNDLRTAVIDGQFYYISKNMQSGLGEKWIEFTDGTIIKTSNLWHSGQLPVYFQQYMPNNARFIPEDER